MTSYCETTGRDFPRGQFPAPSEFRRLGIAMECVVLDLPDAQQSFETVAEFLSKGRDTGNQTKASKSGLDRPIDVAETIQWISKAADAIAKAEGDDPAKRFLAEQRELLADSIAETALPMIERLANHYRLPEESMTEAVYFMARGLLTKHVPGFQERHAARMEEKAREWRKEHGRATSSHSYYPNLFIDNDQYGGWCKEDWVGYVPPTPALALNQDSKAKEAMNAAMEEIRNLPPKPEGYEEPTWPPKSKRFSFLSLLGLRRD